MVRRNLCHNRMDHTVDLQQKGKKKREEKDEKKRHYLMLHAPDMHKR